MPKDMQIAIRVDDEDKELIERALAKAQDNHYLVKRSSLFMWLVKRYLAE